MTIIVSLLSYDQNFGSISQLHFPASAQIVSASIPPTCLSPTISVLLATLQSMADMKRPLYFTSYLLSPLCCCHHQLSFIVFFASPPLCWPASSNTVEGHVGHVVQVLSPFNATSMVAGLVIGLPCFSSLPQNHPCLTAQQEDHLWGGLMALNLGLHSLDGFLLCIGASQR